MNRTFAKPHEYAFEEMCAVDLKEAIETHSDISRSHQQWLKTSHQVNHAVFLQYYMHNCKNETYPNIALGCKSRSKRLKN
jgi:hypothetical protein